MRSRREFIQLASVSAMLLATKSWSSVAAKQKLKTMASHHFDKKLNGPMCREISRSCEIIIYVIGMFREGF